MHAHRVALRLASLDGADGLFVVDVVANGVASRAVFSKGSLHHFERIEPFGHVFSAIDKDSRSVVKKVRFMHLVLVIQNNSLILTALQHVQGFTVGGICWHL